MDYFVSFYGDVFGMKLEKYSKINVNHTSESNTAGLEKEFFSPLYVRVYPHFGRH